MTSMTKYKNHIYMYGGVGDHTNQDLNFWDQS